MRPLLLSALAFASLWFAGNSAAAGTTDEAPVIRVRLEGQLTEAMVALTRRAVATAEAEEASHLILEISTPGGRVTLMERIVDALEEAQSVQTVALVERATSAGALIAIACDYLLMTPGAHIGSAYPIFMLPIPLPTGGMDPKAEEELQRELTAREEKMVSDVRAEFRTQAERTQRNESIAEAMVDPRIVLYEITVDGVRDIVSEKKLRNLQELHGKQAVRQLGFVCAEGEILNLTTMEADRLEFSDGVAADLEGALEWLEIADADVTTLETSFSEEFASWVQTWSWALILVGLISVFMEIKIPGFGLPGFLGILALSLVLYGKFLAGQAELPEILLMGVGFVLVAVEIFIVPGTLVAGGVGILCILIGVLMSFNTYTLPVSAPIWAQDEWWRNLRTLGLSTAASLIGMVFIGFFAPKLPIINRIMLRSTTPPSKTSDLGQVVDEAHRAWAPALGARGRAVSPLRPAGKIELEGRQVDVVAEGQFVPPGTDVRVVFVQGNRVVVRAFDDA